MRYLISVNVVTDGILGDIYSVSAVVYDEVIGNTIEVFYGKLPNSILKLDIIKKPLINKNSGAYEFKTLTLLVEELKKMLDKYAGSHSLLFYDFSKGTQELLNLLTRYDETSLTPFYYKKILMIENLEEIFPNTELKERYLRSKLNSLDSLEVAKLNISYFISLEELMFRLVNNVPDVLNNIDTETLLQSVD